MTFPRNFAYVVNLFVVSLILLLMAVMINMLLEIIKILHEEMIKTLNSVVLFPQRCIREKELTKWSFQGTSNISIEVLHTSSQLKST